MLTKEKQQYLKNIYFSPSLPTAFSGLEKVWKIIRRDGKVTKKELREWLLQQDSYTSYKQVRRKVRRPRTIVPYANAVFGSDVAYMVRFEKSNDGYSYFVVFIDIFTRFAWAYPLKTLQGKEMVQVMKKLFETEKCEKLFTDGGTEYNNNLVKAYLRKEEIDHYVSKNEKKVAHAERFIKQLKLKLIKYMNENNTFKWVDVLGDLVNSYNNSYHRSIQMTPNQARNSDQHTLWTNQYNKKPKIKRKPARPKNKTPFKFKDGDRVKLLANLHPFQREYDQKFTTEVFTITDRKVKDSIPSYSIKDEQNDPITGRFFENELLKVIAPDDRTYKIEKVLRKRTRNGKKELFVKFVGYPKKFNAWVSDIDYLK